MSEGLDPQAEADRIRLKRLARLGGVASSAATPSSSVSSPTTDSPRSAGPSQSPVASKTKPSPVYSPPPNATAGTASGIRPSTHVSHGGSRSTGLTAAPAKKASTHTPSTIQGHGAEKFEFGPWENSTIAYVLGVTLDRRQAERHYWSIVWLKHLQAELEVEEPAIAKPVQLKTDMIDRLLIARLEVDPNAMSDDDDYAPVLASLPKEQTVFEYLTCCWRRHNEVKTTVFRKNYPPSDVQQALPVLSKLNDLIVSYAGLTLMDPEMFSQPQGKPLGPHELATCLLSLSSLSGPLLSTSSSSTPLTPPELTPFLNDLSTRFATPDELQSVLAEVVRLILFDPSLSLPDGLGGADAGWRRVIGALECLVSVKPIANMVASMEAWCPEEATPEAFEKVALMGPLMRLGVFSHEWPQIGTSYFSDPSNRSQTDIESSNAGLRGTLKSFQSSLFQIFNVILRASPEARESVLQFFSRAISLNVKRSGMQFDRATVASDSFMINLQNVLLRLAEPFMDATYSKLDRIDPHYLCHSTRVNVKDETRIKATNEEADKWSEEIRSSTTFVPNFISDIFYLTAAASHYGLNSVLQSFDDLGKHLDELQRHHDQLAGDTSWQGSPLQARMEAAIAEVKTTMDKVRMEKLSYKVQLLDPEYVFRQIGFTNFLETWLIRVADPKKSHPKPQAEIPLPLEVPMVFRILPEYFVEDIVDFSLFVMRRSPMSFDLAGKHELVLWALTFMRSTWYIKNPFLKAKMNEVLFFGILGYGRKENGVLGNLLNSDPVALKHLMPAMMSFYIEVEQTGASSQFYDKFNARRNIAYILKAVWGNPTHREALRSEAQNIDKFVRFVNLMINDVTYLLDESLSELSQIAEIEREMAQPDWNNQPSTHRRERLNTLRSIERHASGYVTLGRSTVDLLKVFTGETKAPFMVPEIVGRLAAMLDYNLDALAGPRCGDLKVNNPEKYRFNPAELLTDILQVYLNLHDQPEFIRAVAEDGRSYNKELFAKAFRIAQRKTLKTDPEIDVLRKFVENVEEMKALIEVEEDLGDVPDEFLDPLMATLMRDPVTLPSSKAVVDRATIKAHLLSDNKDPFNRAPLSMEEVIPHPELKERIEAFVKERRKTGGNQGASTAPTEEKMDVE